MQRNMQKLSSIKNQTSQRLRGNWHTKWCHKIEIVMNPLTKITVRSGKGAVQKLSDQTQIDNLNCFNQC